MLLWIEPHCFIFPLSKVQMTWLPVPSSGLQPSGTWWSAAYAQMVTPSVAASAQAGRTSSPVPPGGLSYDGEHRGAGLQTTGLVSESPFPPDWRPTCKSRRVTLTSVSLLSKRGFLVSATLWCTHVSHGMLGSWHVCCMKGAQSTLMFLCLWVHVLAKGICNQVKFPGLWWSFADMNTQATRACHPGCLFPAETEQGLRVLKLLLQINKRGLPGGPVVKSLHFRRRAHGFGPWSETKILCAEWHSQIKISILSVVKKKQTKTHCVLGIFVLVVSSPF